MAQTGLTTSVALIPESSWRTAPITVVSGAANTLGITGKAPYRGFTVEPGGGLTANPDILAADNEIDGDIELGRTIKQAVTYNGGFTFKADAENLYYPLLGIFGKDVQTVAQASPAMSQHVFTKRVYFPSFTVEEVFGDKTYGRVSTGVVINSLDLTFAKTLMAKIGLIPYRQIPNNYPNAANVDTDYQYTNTQNLIPQQMGGDGTKTWARTLSPTYIDVEQEQPLKKYGSGPFVFAGITYGLVGGSFAAAYMTVDDVPVAVQILEGCTLNITRKIDATMIAGSGFDPGACTGSQLGFRGHMNVLFDSLTIQLAAIKHQKVALNFQIVGSIYGAAGILPYIIDIYLPNIRWLVPAGPEVTDGPIMVGGDYVARRDPTLQYACRITLRNSYDSTQLGGQYPLLPADGTALAAITSAAAATVTFVTAKNIVAGDIHTYQNASINGGVAVNMTVLSVNYTTNVVTYTAVVGFAFPATTATTLTRNLVGGGGGWSNQ